MKHVLYIAVAVMTVNLFCNANSPSEKVHHYANDVKATIKDALKKPATPTEQAIGVVMVVGGVCSVLYNRTISGLFLAAGGSLLVTGKAQDALDYAKKKANELVDCVKNDTKAVASR